MSPTTPESTTPGPTPPDTITAEIAVIGAGVAGCVMARRLAERGRDVVLLEAGAHRAPEAAGVMDIGPDSLVAQRYTARSGTDEFALPRGRTLGGSGAVNGGYCLAADPREFAGWPAPRSVGTAHSDRREPEPWPERYRTGLRRATERLSPQFYPPDPTAAAVADAFPESMITVGQARSGPLRSTAFEAWDPAAAGARIVTGAEVRELEEGRAHLADGRTVDAGEMILCAGTIGTTELLFRSGFGDDPAHPVGRFAREHPEALLDLPPEFPRVAVLTPDAAEIPPLLSAVARFRLDSGHVVEVRPYSVPFHALISGLEPVPHRIGVALMNPRGSARVSYDPVADDGSPGAGVVIDLDGARDPRDAAALDEASALVSRRLGLTGPPHRSTSQHLAGTAAVGTVVDADGRVYGAPWLRVADASMHHDLTTVGPYLSVAAIAEALAGGVG